MKQWNGGTLTQASTCAVHGWSLSAWCFYRLTEEGTLVVTAYQAVLRCGGAVFAERYMHDMLFAVHVGAVITYGKA